MVYQDIIYWVNYKEPSFTCILNHAYKKKEKYKNYNSKFSLEHKLRPFKKNL